MEKQQSPALFNRYQNYVLEKGLKKTKKRDLIVSEFLKTDGHITISDLLLTVKAKDSSIGSATIYRTMSLLKEADLAEERSFMDSTPAYEVKQIEDHHDHLICTECSKVIEFIDLRIEKLQNEISESHDFTLTDHKMELYGICTDCKKGNSPK